MRVLLTALITLIGGCGYWWQSFIEGMDAGALPCLAASGCDMATPTE